MGIVATLAEMGIDLEYVDLGGGYGVSYEDEPEIDLERLAELVTARLAGSGLLLVLELGRFVVGGAGFLLTRVLDVKRSDEKTFVVTDGGMTELLRPSHYGGYHRIEPVRSRPGAPTVTADVVGPVCETGDFLARDRQLELPAVGDLLVVHTAGAYGFSMASNYNSRPEPAEVMVEGESAPLIRERETLADLIRGEPIP